MDRLKEVYEFVLRCFEEYVEEREKRIKVNVCEYLLFGIVVFVRNCGVVGRNKI